MSTVGLALASFLSISPPPEAAPPEAAPVEAPTPPAPEAPPPTSEQPSVEPPAAAPAEPPAAAPVEPPAAAPVEPAPAAAPVEPPPAAAPVEPAPAITVTPAPAPPPPTVPDWGPQADVAISQPSPVRPEPIAPPPEPYEPPPKPMMGVGLMVSSAVVFTIGLGARLRPVDRALNTCRRWSEAEYDSVNHCFNAHDFPGLDYDDMFVGLAYGSSMVLTMIGTGALGRYQAWQSVHGDLRTRNPVARYAFGAMFTGLGLASIGAHYALIYANSKNPCTSWECNAQRRALWIAASDGGALLLNTGFGMFSWASHYNRNLQRYRGGQWTVLPGASVGSVGATASVRF